MQSGFKTFLRSFFCGECNWFVLVAYLPSIKWKSFDAFTKFVDREKTYKIVKLRKNSIL